jgi:hypothetical protein
MSPRCRSYELDDLGLDIYNDGAPLGLRNPLLIPYFRAAEFAGNRPLAASSTLLLSRNCRADYKDLRVLSARAKLGRSGMLSVVATTYAAPQNAANQRYAVNKPVFRDAEDLDKTSATFVSACLFWQIRQYG